MSERINDLQNQASQLVNTLKGYLQLAKDLYVEASAGEELFPAEELEDYLSANHLQRYANRIMCGANIALIGRSNLYPIEEIIYALNSLMPPLKECHYDKEDEEVYLAEKKRREQL